jgi:putative membrane protein
MMWWWDGPMPWMMFWPIIMIGFMVVCVVVMMAMMRGGGMRMPPWRKNDPLGVLKERFARGEIDQKEYEDRRRLLTQS